jgi:3'-phosphoadenosine 5'-phosphosulfate sulfotransferase (PAPS reductase)/FAD synthetase
MDVVRMIMDAGDKADSERRARVHRKVAEALDIVSEAIQEHIWPGPKKRLAGAVVLFSGGDDSTVLAHLFRRDCDYFAHINTGICVLDEDAEEEESAAANYVRTMAEKWDVPLIEEHGDSYRDLVIEHGFPGPAHHFKMYQRLKERGLRKVRKRLVANGRKERVLFIAGRRRQESDRRKDIPTHERDGSIVWASPLAHWSARDLNDYRTAYGVERSPVAQEIHMSGECLCGAFAKKGEREMFKFFRPRTDRYIATLEDEVLAAGNVPPERCKWGWGAYRGQKVDANQLSLMETGPLCSSCEWEPGA